MLKTFEQFEDDPFGEDRNFVVPFKYQRFEEKEEEITISRRPKKIEKRMIGRIYWDQEFKDGDTGESIWIERSRIVRINGIWLHPHT